MTDQVRVLRILEYTGPRDEVEQLVALSVHGLKKVGGGVEIRGATIGGYPEILNGEPDAQTEEPDRSTTDKQAEAREES